MVERQQTDRERAQEGTQASEVAALVAPRSIAIVGASADRAKFGGRMIEVLLLHGFDGDVYPINPRSQLIFGKQSYPSLSEVPGNVDLVVFAVPLPAVFSAIADCAARHVKICVIISTEFGESRDGSGDMERNILDEARRHGIRILGVNCLGFFNRAARTVLIPSPAMYLHLPLPPGGIGMVSQSGAILATVFDKAVGLGLGFSHGITVGNQTDLTVSDFIRFLADDPATKVICCYLEGIRNGVGLAEALGYAASLNKPVVLLKSGRTSEGARVAFSHTASLASDYEIFHAYMTRVGAIVVDDPGVMLAVASLLERYEGIAIDEVIIVTNSGGAAAFVTDRLHDEGLRLRTLSEATRSLLMNHYHASHAHNPIDWGASSESSETRLLDSTFAALAEEPAGAIVLDVLLTNPDLGGIAEALARNGARSKHPAMVLVLPDQVADVSRDVLRNTRTCFVDDVNHAVKAIALLSAWTDARRNPYPVPDRPDWFDAQGSHVDSPEWSGGEFVDALNTKALLGRYGIRVNATRHAANNVEAVRMAAVIGYPVALKVSAPEISHKSDVGGVRIGIVDDEHLRIAWDEIVASVRRARPDADIDGMVVEQMIGGELECFVGIKSDESFGPAVVFGAGGVLIEVLRDSAIMALPVTAGQVKDRLERLAIAPLLHGYRGRPALDIDALAELIERVGWMACDMAGRLIELDLNPVMVRAAGHGVIAVDARARFRSVEKNVVAGS